jgi:hypothetical protein
MAMYPRVLFEFGHCNLIVYISIEVHFTQLSGIFQQKSCQQMNLWHTFEMIVVRKAFRLLLACWPPLE